MIANNDQGANNKNAGLRDYDNKNKAAQKKQIMSPQSKLSQQDINSGKLNEKSNSL